VIIMEQSPFEYFCQKIYDPNAPEPALYSLIYKL
jgi:hypothetical protein